MIAFVIFNHFLLLVCFIVASSTFFYESYDYCDRKDLFLNIIQSNLMLIGGVVKIACWL